VNLVGHVAAALAPDATPPSTDFLVGCMLPDLAAIARVRVARPDGDLGDGVEFHHACDAVFHESEWFRTANRSLRDALVDASVGSGPARACSHAGVEMLLDGRLIADERVDAHTRNVLATVCTGAPALGALAPAEHRDAWVERLQMIGSSLDPSRYRDAGFVAERLHRMTNGRRRIELPAEQVDIVTTALRDVQPGITDAATGVVTMVRLTVLDARAPIPHHQG
jgi:hypothetical protein